MAEVISLTKNARDEFISELEAILEAIKAGEEVPRALITIRISSEGGMKVIVAGKECATSNILGTLTLAEHYIIAHTME